MATGRRQRVLRVFRLLTDQRGVAVLLEVVLGILLLSLAIIPVFYGLTAVAVASGGSLTATVAVNILKEQAEKVKAAGYTALEAPASPTDPPVTTPITSYPGFKIVQAVSWVPLLVDTKTGAPVAKKVALEIYRIPHNTTDPALGTWELILYEKGI